MSWAACDRLAKVAAASEAAGAHPLLARARRHDPRADPREAWSEERQAFAESFGGRDLDASVLLMAEVDFLTPTTRASSHRGRAGEVAVRRPLHAPLRGRRRFRQAGDRLQHLHLLAHRRAGAHRPQGQAREIFEVMLRAATTGPAVRGHHPGDRRDVGQLPADLFDGRHDQRRGAAVGALGRHGLGRRLAAIRRALIRAPVDSAAPAHSRRAGAACRPGPRNRAGTWSERPPPRSGRAAAGPCGAPRRRACARPGPARGT